LIHDELVEVMPSGILKVRAELRDDAVSTAWDEKGKIDASDSAAQGLQFEGGRVRNEEEQYEPAASAMQPASACFSIGVDAPESKPLE
jgi:hypothetical protein